MVQGMSRDASYEFSKTILVRYVLSYLCGTLYLDAFYVIKKDLCIFCRGSFHPFNPCLNLPENKIPLLLVTTLQANVKLEGSGKRGWEGGGGILGRLLL